MNKSLVSYITTMLLIYLVNSSYKTADGIFVGAYAFCSSTCSQSSNSGCTGKCITFKDNNGGYNIRDMKYLAEVCWNIYSCAEFPKFYAFQTDENCGGECEVNAFPGFSKNQLNNLQLYYAKGYNMMCIEESNSDSPLPNLCRLAQPYAVLFQNKINGLVLLLIFLLQTLIFM